MRSTALETAEATFGRALATSRCSFQMAKILSTCWVGFATLMRSCPNLLEPPISWLLGQRPFAGFELKHRLVPRPVQPCIQLRNCPLSPLRSSPPEDRLHPSIFLA